MPCGGPLPESFQNFPRNDSTPTRDALDWAVNGEGSGGSLAGGRTEDLVISVRGELHAAAAGQLDDAIAAAVERNRGVILDLRECDSIDSNGLESILRAAKKLRAIRASRSGIWLLCGKPEIRRVLGLAAIDQTIPIMEAVPLAVSAGPRRNGRPRRP